MDSLENVAQKEGAMTEVEMKQENNQELNKKEILGTEFKYENNQSVKEEVFDELGNGYDFMETVLVEVKQELGQEIRYFCDQCEFTSKH